MNKYRTWLWEFVGTVPTDIFKPFWNFSGMYKTTSISYLIQSRFDGQFVAFGQKIFGTATICPPRRLDSVIWLQINKSCSERALPQILSQGIVVCFPAGPQLDGLFCMGAFEGSRTILQFGERSDCGTQSIQASHVWEPASKPKSLTLNIYCLK